MNSFTSFWTRRISRESVDVGIAQIACYLGGIGILILGFWKLTRMPVTEAELFFGVLLVLLTAVVMIAIGLLMHLIQLVKDQDTARGREQSILP